MIVAICYTKKGASRTLCDWFAEGVLNSGDEILKITSKSDLPLLDKCDVSFQICEDVGAKESGMSTVMTRLREDIRVIQKNNCKRRIIYDAGYVKHVRDKKSRESKKKQKRKYTKAHEVYHAIGYDGIKNYADFYNENSPPDRWEKLGVELTPWRKDGDHILVFGQSENNIGMKNVRKLLNISNPKKNLAKVRREYERLLKALREITDKKIIYRYHPNQRKGLARVPNNVEFTHPANNFIRDHGATPRLMEEDLENCWAAICLGGTNAAVDAVVKGVPVICPEVMNMAYDVSEHDLSNIENPATPDREQWAYNLAYAQWTSEEMANGTCWRHLRPHVNEI